jgi:Xaa-Pro aminopeptidase
MRISHQEFERRYVAIKELIKKDELDSLLIVGRPGSDVMGGHGNIRYITGSGRGGYCVFPLEGAPIFLINPRQSSSPGLPKTVDALGLLDLRETSDPIKQVKEELSRLDKGNRVGIVGMADISVPMYLAVKEQFHDRLVDAIEIFGELLLIKSPEEIEMMRVSASIADKIVTVLRDMVRPCLSDYEIYAEVKKMIYEMGCEYSFELIDAEGCKMNMTFQATGARLEANGTLFLEITPAYKGYYTQRPVTLPVGKNYPPHIAKMVDVWQQSIEAVENILRPGTKVIDVYHTIVNTVHKGGYASPLNQGHMMGLDGGIPWGINEHSTGILKSGMTFTIHPNVIVELGGDGVGMGYTYLITDTGAENLNKVDLASLGISLI